jgi:hypothetical protein
MVEGVDSLCFGYGSEKPGHLGKVFLLGFKSESKVSLMSLGLSDEASL